MAELHGTNNLTKQTALTEKGEVVNGRGDTPNMHDILTGSQPDGTAFAAGEDRTCGNWTKSGAGRGDGRPSRPQGLATTTPAKSWNSSHPSRGDGGCSQDDLKSTGGAGLLYCFADEVAQPRRLRRYSATSSVQARPCGMALVSDTKAWIWPGYSR